MLVATALTHLQLRPACGTPHHYHCTRPPPPCCVRPGPQPSDFHLPPHHPLGSAYPPHGGAHAAAAAAMAAANRQSLMYNPRGLSEAQRAAAARERQEEMLRAQAARGREAAERKAEKERKAEEKKK